jgi:hypothetical protein
LKQHIEIIPDFERDYMTNLKTVAETAVELGKHARESVEELGRSAGERLDEARDETGGALHAAASSIRATGRHGCEAVGGIANNTADKLDATASYVEDHDLRRVYAGLRKIGRRHMAGSLAIAAGIGFLAGAALVRVAHSCVSPPKGA